MDCKRARGLLLCNGMAMSTRRAFQVEALLFSNSNGLLEGKLSRAFEANDIAGKNLG